MVETELMLSDLESLERRLSQAQKRARGGDKESLAAVALMEPLVAALTEGRPARTAIPAGEEEAVRRLQLLTSKPVLYVCNVEEASAASGNAFSDRVRAWAARAARAIDRRLRRDRSRGVPTARGRPRRIPGNPGA